MSEDKISADAQKKREKELEEEEKKSKIQVGFSTVQMMLAYFRCDEMFSRLWFPSWLLYHVIFFLFFRNLRRTGKSPDRAGLTLGCLSPRRTKRSGTRTSSGGKSRRKRRRKSFPPSGSGRPDQSLKSDKSTHGTDDWKLPE